MKAKTLALLAGAGGSLLIASQADAGFTGISWTSTASANGTIIRVFANFTGSSPADHMIAVAGTPGAPMNIEAVGGTFFQSAVGSDNAPNPAFFGVFPTLANDTFVSIGTLTSVTDATSLSPGWPGFSGGTGPLGGTNISWFITPADPIGDPAGGSVVLGQFTLASGTGLQFNAKLTFSSDGDGGASAVISQFIPVIPGPGAFALLGLAGLVGTRRRRS